MRLPKDDLPAKHPDFRFPLSEVPMPDLDWTTKAACRRSDLKGRELQDYVNEFFPARGAPVKASIFERCKTCPVKLECESFSVQWNVRGIWAGRREEQRKIDRRRARRLKGAA